MHFSGVLGDNCTMNNDCSTAVTNSICSSVTYQCECVLGYHAENNVTCTESEFNENDNTKQQKLNNDNVSYNALLK